MQLVLATAQSKLSPPSKSSARTTLKRWICGIG